MEDLISTYLFQKDNKNIINLLIETRGEGGKNLLHSAVESGMAIFQIRKEIHLTIFLLNLIRFHVILILQKTKVSSMHSLRLERTSTLKIMMATHRSI